MSRRPLVRALRRAAWVAMTLVLLLVAWLFSLGGEVDEWVRERRGQVAEVERGEAEEFAPGIVAQPLRIVSTTGLTVFARVLRPDPPPPSGRLVVILGGHRTGRDAISLVGDPHGFVVAALDYPYDGPERPRGLRQSLATLRKVRPALFDTPAAVSLAIDAMLSEPGVDGQAIELVGASLGVPFAATAAALDERITRVWLVHGGADNRRWLDHALRRRIETPWLRRATTALLHHVGRLGSLDAGRRVPQLGERDLVVIASRDDQRVPRESLDALLAAAPPQTPVVWTEGPHLDPRRPELVREVVRLVLERM
jgi:dienelactone hydrolase